VSGGTIKIKDKNKLIRIFKTISWLDKCRWKNKNNYDFINFFKEDLTNCEKILTHWICYITNRQIPFEIIWDKGGYVFSESPAYTGGLKKGDIIISVDGYNVSLLSFIDYIKNNPGKEIKFEILRKGKKMQLVIIPNIVKGGIGRIGIVPIYVPKTVKVNLSFFKAIYQASFISAMVIYKNLEGLYNLVTGKLSVKDSLGGPIMIAKMAMDTLEEGWIMFLKYMAIISIVLMVMNLLPIPPLDGWHILMAGIEILRGKPISQKVQEGLAKFGFILLVGFIIFVLFLDIERLGVIKKFFGSK